MKNDVGNVVSDGDGIKDIWGKYMEEVYGESIWRIS